MEEKFEMVAKTMKGLEAVLADELRALGADDVMPGRRMVSFSGDLEMLYKANLWCRTALCILKPFYKFEAKNADTLYEMVKEFDWSTILSVDQTFRIDTVVNSEEFQHSRFVTYKVKDAIVDWFRDRYGSDKRPGVRLEDADIMINVHITDENVTLSLDSSGESLYKRGYRVAQNDAPINEVLAAGIILLSGWKGETTFVDPMCGSGTFLVEAALIAANIPPGIYRKSFAFEQWPDFNQELFESLYNDDSQEREVTCKIYGADISPKAIAIATENVKSAGVAQYISLECKPISQWTEAPQPAGVLVTNPPYGKRISVDDMEGLYSTIGTVLKNVFVGYNAWIIGYEDEYFHCIGLAPSEKIALLNGSLDCELREYVIFAGNKKEFRASGGKLKEDRPLREDRPKLRHFDDDDDDRYSKRHKSDDRPKRRRFDDDEDDRGGKRRKFDDRPKRRSFDDDEDERFEKRRKQDDRPKRNRFGDGEDRSDKYRKFDDRPKRPRFDGDKDNRSDNRRYDDRPKRRFDDRDSYNVEEPENPLAKRRNVRALEALSGKRPSLPPAEGEAPKMRSRGWRKKDGENN